MEQARNTAAAIKIEYPKKQWEKGKHNE